MASDFDLMETRRPRFEVSLSAEQRVSSANGRLLIVLSPRIDLEPRHQIGILGPNAPIVFGCDGENLSANSRVLIDDRAAFPHPALPGEYLAQAIFDDNRDLRLPHAPGNLVSAPVLVRVGLDEVCCQLELSRSIPPERPPAESEQVRYVALQSSLLSAFHGRAIWLRAGVILPRDFDREPGRMYPLRVNIGGYGSRYSIVDRMMAPRTGFRETWNADDSPRMVLLRLDGAGPLGDPHQVNSANHGPYGDAVVHELIPHVERMFRAGGSARSRFLDGVSTGGWAALALQIFYPDQFGGAWACCPDSVDFRSFETIDIYADENAYVDSDGIERAASRDLADNILTTIRHECALENVLGHGDSWALSGGQWGAWNATFSPRGDDGRPVPLWDPITGAIDRVVAEHWKQFDLRLILERNWETLGPQLRGKLHITSGESDEYFLNDAVQRLQDFFATASPPFDGSIVFGPGEGHGWSHRNEQMLLAEMASRGAWA